MSQISRRLRFEILKRDGFKCRYCGTAAEASELTVDHVVPVALGGNGEPSNLTTACADCNGGKTSSHLDDAVVDDVDEDAVKWAEAMRRAAEVQRAKSEPGRQVAQEFQARWNNFTYTNGDPIHLPADWAQTVMRFHNLGLNIDEIEQAVSVAMAADHIRRDRFKYFCGACWNIIRERQDIARELLSDDEGQTEGG